MSRKAAAPPPGPFGREWEAYRWRCVPAEAGPGQVGAAQRAFYSGAAAVLRQLLAAPTQAAITQLTQEAAEHAAMPEPQDQDPDAWLGPPVVSVHTSGGDPGRLRPVDAPATCEREPGTFHFQASSTPRRATPESEED